MAKLKTGRSKPYKSGSTKNKNVVAEGAVSYGKHPVKPEADKMLVRVKKKPVEKHSLTKVVKMNNQGNIPIRLTPVTPIEKMEMVRTGVSKYYLEKVKLQTKLDYQKLAKLLAVTRATLINKKKHQKFNTSLSERIVGLADLFDYGYEVFEDEDKFSHWMSIPNRALGGEIPYDVIDNQYGREEVKNILGRLEYGGYS